MRDYYQILGVDTDATHQEIRAAFRKLALQYHPDRNRDADAIHVFQQINEAYDVLSDSEKRAKYDQRRSNPWAEILQQDVQPQHRDPAYRRRAPRPPQMSDVERYRLAVKPFIPYVYIIIKVAIAFSGLNLLDALLPTLKSQERVVRVIQYTTSTRNADLTYVVFETDKGSKIRPAYNNYVESGMNVTIYRSIIFQTPKRVKTDDGSEMRVPITIIGNFIFAPIVLMVVSLMSLFEKRIDQVFNYGVGIAFILFLNIYFFMLDKMY